MRAAAARPPWPRSIAGLIPPQRGKLRFDGADITRPVHRRSPELLRHIQYVFQNPASSLNPPPQGPLQPGPHPSTCSSTLSKAERRDRMAELLASVHLDPGYIDRYPPQLSGGEAQRVAIAQALAAEPKLILCDEILSALDVSVQDNILELLRELQASTDVAYLFIAHDLAVVRWLADRVVVLYHGRIVEQGTVEEIFTPPHHPYTALLLDSIPGKGEHEVSALAEDASTVGTAPDAGCAFEPRCHHRIAGVCEVDDPPRLHDSETHDVLCHLSANRANDPPDPDRRRRRCRQFRPFRRGDLMTDTARLRDRLQGCYVTVPTMFRDDEELSVDPRRHAQACGLPGRRRDHHRQRGCCWPAARPGTSPP